MGAGISYPCWLAFSLRLPGAALDLRAGRHSDGGAGALRGNLWPAIPEPPTHSCFIRVVYYPSLSQKPRTYLQKELR